MISAGIFVAAGFPHDPGDGFFFVERGNDDGNTAHRRTSQRASEVKHERKHVCERERDRAGGNLGIKVEVVEKGRDTQPEQACRGDRERNAAADDARCARITAPDDDNQRNKCPARESEQHCRYEFAPESGREPTPG